MSKKQKLIYRLKSKPKDFTFDEAKSLLRLLGFKLSNKGKTSGSRTMFIKGHIKIIIHKPHPHNELRDYQIIDIIMILDKEKLIWVIY